jgi:hypothetical protein
MCVHEQYHHVSEHSSLFHPVYAYAYVCVCDVCVCVCVCVHSCFFFFSSLSLSLSLSLFLSLHISASPTCLYFEFMHACRRMKHSNVLSQRCPTIELSCSLQPSCQKKTIHENPNKHKHVQVSEDVALLQTLGLMNYSLRVGLHKRQPSSSPSKPPSSTSYPSIFGLQQGSWKSSGHVSGLAPKAHASDSGVHEATEGSSMQRAVPETSHQASMDQGAESTCCAARDQTDAACDSGYSKASTAVRRMSGMHTPRAATGDNSSRLSVDSAPCTPGSDWGAARWHGDIDRSLKSDLLSGSAISSGIYAGNDTEARANGKGRTNGGTPLRHFSISLGTLIDDETIDECHSEEDVARCRSLPTDMEAGESEAVAPPWHIASSTHSSTWKQHQASRDDAAAGVRCTADFKWLRIDRTDSATSSSVDGFSRHASAAPAEASTLQQCDSLQRSPQAPTARSPAAASDKPQILPQTHAHAAQRHLPHKTGEAEQRAEAHVPSPPPSSASQQQTPTNVNAQAHHQQEQLQQQRRRIWSARKAMMPCSPTLAGFGGGMLADTWAAYVKPQSSDSKESWDIMDTMCEDVSGLV